MRKFSTIFLASAAMFAMPAIAQQDNLPAEDETVEGEIIVFGRGETRQVQELTSKELLILAPGTSVNFQSADPFGTYEWQAAFRSAGLTRTSWATHSAAFR